MARKILKKGDKVRVYVSVEGNSFTGRIIEMNDVACKDVWYRVKPDGEGVAQGRSFWHRESHIKKDKNYGRCKTQ